MFRPEETEGLGLTDITGGTCNASRRACIAEARTVFLPPGKYRRSREQCKFICYAEARTVFTPPEASKIFTNI